MERVDPEIGVVICRNPDANGMGNIYTPKSVSGRSRGLSFIQPSAIQPNIHWLTHLFSPQPPAIIITVFSQRLFTGPCVPRPRSDWSRPVVYTFSVHVLQLVAEVFNVLLFAQIRLGA